MTAIGFALACVGWFLAKVAYEPYEPEQSSFFHISAGIAFVGVVLVLAGIVAWLWGIMP